MDFSIIPVEDIDIPFSDLQAKQPEIERFSASTLVFLCDSREPLSVYVLLCQRAPFGKDDNGKQKPNSWPFSWEPPGGGHEISDETILNTAKREAKEEVNLHGARVSRQVYRDSWIHKGTWMARYTFALEVHEQLKPQRTWCDSQQQTVGTDEGPIQLRTDEHLDYCWATEAQIRHSASYDGNVPQHQRGLVILESKKAMILDAFMRLRKSELDMTYTLG